MDVMEEFIVNDFLRLRFEHEKTFKRADFPDQSHPNTYIFTSSISFIFKHLIKTRTTRNTNSNVEFTISMCFN